MNKYERRRRAIEQAQLEHAREIKSIYAREKDPEHGDLNEDERLEVEEHTRAIEVLREEKAEVEANIKTLQHADDVERKFAPNVPGDGIDFATDVQVKQGPIDRIMANAVKSIGQQFVESKGFQSVYQNWKGGNRHEFNTGSIEIKAGTLSEAAGLGAGLIPVPQVVPGVVQTLFQRLTIEDLLTPGQANTNSVRYIVEGTATSGAAGVAEAAVKPGSTLGLSTVDEPVKKIATSLVVTDETLEDVDQVQSYVNGRLTLFVANRVEASLINGAGTNDLVGLIQGARGINGLGLSGTDNVGDTLFKAINGCRGSAQLEPDWVVISPASWQKLRLLRDAAGGTAGQYLGGGPFQIGPYGGPMGPAMASNQVNEAAAGPNDYLWGKPVYVTSALSAGSALVGTRAGAQVWSRGGLNVNATNSGYVQGADLFTQNLVAIRAERRLALAVYRPSAFCLVTGL